MKKISHLLKFNYFQELLIVIIVILTSHYYLKPEKTIIRADGKGYYEYLPAIFIYHDLHWNYIDTLDTPGYYKHSEYDVGAIKIINDDIRYNKFFVGTAILMSPFFMMGHIYAKINNEAVDGYSRPYQELMWISALFYLWIGLFFIRKLLTGLKIKGLIIFIVQLLLVFATPCLHYVTFESTFSHVYSFSVISALMYYCWLFINKQENKFLYIIAALCCLTIIIRPFNIIIVLIVPFFFTGFNQFFDFIKLVIAKKKIPILISIIIGLSILSIQMLTWYFQTGDLILDSYNQETFNFKNPHFINILFSYKKGLFLYSPVLFLGLLLGLVVGIINKKYYTIFWLSIPFLLFTFILSSWWSWWYGMSYGQRSYVDILVFFAIIMAYGLNKIPTKIFYFIVPIFLITIPITIIQCFQYKTYILHWDDMNKNTFWEVFLKTEDQYRGVLWQEKIVYPKNQVTNQYNLVENIKLIPKTNLTLFELTDIKAAVPNSFNIVEFSGDIIDNNSNSKMVLVLKNEADSAIYWVQQFTYHQTRGKKLKKNAKFQYKINKEKWAEAKKLSLFIESENLTIGIKKGMVRLISTENEQEMDYYLPRLEKQIVKIKNDSILLDAIKNEIKLTGEKLEVRILKEAELAVQKEDRIRMIINKIKQDKDWLQAIINKASQQGISLEEMMEIDAEYLLKQEEKIKN